MLVVNKKKYNSWPAFPIPEEVIRALLENNINEPLPIQISALKACLIKNLNFLGAAQTGSGKTFAYAIPMITHILENKDNPSSKLKAKICKMQRKKEDFELLDGEMLSVEDMIVDKLSNQESISYDDDNDDYSETIEVTSACPEAIILVPTRELANQVKEEVDKICKYTYLKTCCLIGGLSQDKQIRVLKKLQPQIIIATPGRLYEIVQSDTIEYLNFDSVASIRTLVIDEADRMIQKGHFEEMLKIIDIINETKKFRNDGFPFRVYLFSATLTFLHELPERFKTNSIPAKESKSSNPKKANNKLVYPKEHNKKNKIKKILDILGIDRSETKIIDLNDQTSFGRPSSNQLSEYKINCVAQEKDLYLYYFLKQHQYGRVLVFCNSKDCLRRLTNVLKYLGYNVLNLHADMDQKKRLSSLEEFRKSSSSVLIATDVAARGLDIKDLDCVVHYQVPKTCESYIHRSGRTARLNKKGISLTLCEPKEVPYYKRLCNNINNGKDLTDYDIDLKKLANLRNRVTLAQQCDKLDHQLRETKKDRSWFTKAAREAEIELDEEELRHLTGKGKSKDQYIEEDAKKRRQLTQLQKQLNKLFNKS